MVMLLIKASRSCALWCVSVVLLCSLDTLSVMVAAWNKNFIIIIVIVNVIVTVIFNIISINIIIIIPPQGTFTPAVLASVRYSLWAFTRRATR